LESFHPDDVQERMALGKEEARRVARKLIARDLKSSGKSIFCDKSLPNVDLSPFLAELFGRAKFICLYRHPMDFIASALDSCRWGFSAYGLYPYVLGNVNNFVFGLARAWCEKVSMMLEMQQRAPRRCCRLKYEDLVTNPGDAVERLMSFIGVPFESRAVEEALKNPHAAGYGDHKILVTDEISTISLGRGGAVPVRLIPAAGLANMNEMLCKLGYDEIDENWNIKPSRLRQSLLSEVERTNLFAEIQVGLADALNRVGDLGMPIGSEAVTIRIVVEEFTEPRGWIVDARRRSVMPDKVAKTATVTLIVRAHTMVSLLRDVTLLSDAVDRGDIRVGACEEGPRGHEAMKMLRSLLRAPVVRPSSTAGALGDLAAAGG